MPHIYYPASSSGEGRAFASASSQPASPGVGPVPLPTPALPGGDEPASPGVGPVPLPTPALPGGDDSASPGVGPVPLPTPALPSCPPSGCGEAETFCPSLYRFRRVRSGQSFADLLLENDVSFDALTSANPNLSTAQPQAGMVYCAPPEGSASACGGRSYTLREGETIYTLARTQGISAGRLLRANPTLAPSDFRAGRAVCLP